MWICASQNYRKVTKAEHDSQILRKLTAQSLLFSYLWWPWVGTAVVTPCLTSSE